MDLVFEYAKCYGGPPGPTLSWALFLEGVRRTARFNAREMLRAIDGPSVAVSMLSSEGAGERHLMRARLERLGWGIARPLLISGPGAT